MHLGRLGEAIPGAPGALRPLPWAIHPIPGKKLTFCMFSKMHRRIKPSFLLITPM